MLFISIYYGSQDYVKLILYKFEFDCYYKILKMKKNIFMKDELKMILFLSSKGGKVFYSRQKMRLKNNREHIKLSYCYIRSFHFLLLLFLIHKSLLFILAFLHPGF